jgi:hypothetical protein
MPLCLAAASPVFYMPMDGSADVIGANEVKLSAGIVYGRADYKQGMLGKAIDVRRQAYDQVTAVNFPKLPEINCNAGTVSFWFKPDWSENDKKVHWLIHNDAWKGFRYYMVKTKNGSTELSVCAPGQIQILKRNLFKQNEWTHVAFTWSTEQGEVKLFINGREVGKKIDKTSFNHLEKPQPLNLWLGQPGSDRFKANVGDGLYDDIMIFDKVLSPEEIFSIFSGGGDEKMSSLPLSNIFHSDKKIEFVFKLDKKYMQGSMKLLALTGDDPGDKICLIAMGPSRKISVIADIKGEKRIFESNYVLDLSQAHRITLDTESNNLLFYLDEALQGKLEISASFGKLSSLKGIEGISLLPLESFPSEQQIACISNTETSPLESFLWDLSDAQRAESGVRKGICLNGYWRVIPVNDYSYAPPEEKWGYMRVPGSFRSPLYKIYEDKDGQLVSTSWSWAGTSLIKYRAGWYQRMFRIPDNFKKNERIYLDFSNLNGDYGRIYLNGKLIDSFLQNFKCFTVIPNARRLDVTDLISPNGNNVLTIYIDRSYVDLWKGQPSIGDHAEIALGDIWLENAPSKVYLATALAMPSFRKKEVILRARIKNPTHMTGSAQVDFLFQHGKDTPVKFTKDFELKGSAEQLVLFTEKWENPVLWDVEHPELYKMTVSLDVNGNKADALKPVDFGFRELWVEDGGFRMNGKKTRMRMFASPGLNRLRYYYGNPEAIKQYVAYIKEMNYDTVRFDPFRKTSQVAWDRYLTESNCQGLYNLFPMPPYEDEEINEYTKEVTSFFEHYGNHPSILMWYTDMNTCSYPWNQDPAKLNDTDYVPATKIHARQRAQKAEKIMRELDSTREVFQHAGGNSGKIFTSMNYQSFGTPLQEQEDWPKQWSTHHTQPLMVVESAFPYPKQLRYFDNENLGTLGAEHAARYFGDSVFAKEINPIPNSVMWQYSPYSNPPYNILKLSAMLYENVVRAWRAYDMSALGDFPGGRDMHHTAVTYDKHNVVYDVNHINDKVKTSGLKPDRVLGSSETQKHLLTDYSQPTYLHDTVRAAFKPLLIFLAGNVDDFTNKDHAFFSGEKFQKSIIIVNDHTTSQTLSLRWELTMDKGTQVIIDKGDANETLAPGGIVKLPIDLVVPSVYKRTKAKLHLMAFHNDILIKEDSFDLEFFPKHTVSDFANTSAGLYDPEGKTEELLKKAGFLFHKVSTLDEVKKCHLLIIGQNAIKDEAPEFIKQVEKAQLIEKGLKILIFEQKACNLCNFVFESPSARNAFVRRPQSQYLKGLKNEDFSNWRGSSDTVPAFVLSAENSPHYPRSKWKCGNSGIVSGNVIRKPSYGNFTTIVDCGFNLMFASLLELRKGHGLVLFCQLDVTSRYLTDPVATRLVDNILSVMAKPFVPVGAQRVLYLGDSGGEESLKRMGMNFSKMSKFDIWGLSSCQVLILGPNAIPEKNHEDFKKFIQNNQSMAIIALPGAQLELLPGNLKIEKKKLFKASVPEKDPLFAGITNADLYFREVRELPVLSSAPDWMITTQPALFAKLDQVTGAIVVFTISPDDVDGLWNKEKVSRVWSAVFNNMNIGLGQDLELFTASKSRHNTVKYSLKRAALENPMIKFDPQNDVKITDTEGFVPVKLGKSWESQGFDQKNPSYKYPENTPARLKCPYDGYAWYRCTVAIPESWKGYKLRLAGGPIDDCDWTYFNGEKIGETTFDNNSKPYMAKRNYVIPEKLIKYGAENTLLIKVFDRWGEGGVLGKLEVEAEAPDVGDSWSPYIDKLNFYDVDAFHNW